MWTDRQTDRQTHDEADSRFLQIAEVAKFCTCVSPFGCNNKQIFSVQHLLMVISNDNGLYVRIPCEIRSDLCIV